HDLVLRFGPQARDLRPRDPRRARLVRSHLRLEEALGGPLVMGALVYTTAPAIIAVAPEAAPVLLPILEILDDSAEAGVAGSFLSSVAAPITAGAASAGADVGVA